METARALLIRFGISNTSPPRDGQVVEIMSTLARLAAEGTAMCDVGVLVRALSSFVRLDCFRCITGPYNLSEYQPELGKRH